MSNPEDDHPTSESKRDGSELKSSKEESSNSNILQQEKSESSQNEKEG